MIESSAETRSRPHLLTPSSKVLLHVIYYDPWLLLCCYDHYHSKSPTRGRSGAAVTLNPQLCFITLCLEDFRTTILLHKNGIE